jgi:hypothetical protein
MDQAHEREKINKLNILKHKNEEKEQVKTIKEEVSKTFKMILD